MVASASALSETARGRVLAEPGLTSAEARRRFEAEGPNTLPVQRGPGLFRMAAGQLIHFFALLLWAASALAFIAGMPQLGVAIAIVVIVNAAFAFAQEYRAQHAVTALRRLMPSRATVVRDGMRRDVESEEVVRGDLVLLREGDRIPADCHIAASDGLAVDNSMLTGESEPVEKGSSDPLHAGTFVVRGSCQALVEKTGRATRLGTLTSVTGAVVRRPTPLQRQLNHVVVVIAVFAVSTGAVFLAISRGLGMGFSFGFLFAVGVVVALVPEGLLPTLTLSLALSARRLSHDRVLVRRLESVETLGSTTVICSDKTGTLTANQMTVATVWVPTGERYDVSGVGYNPAGTLLADGRPLTDGELARLRPLVEAAALCGNASVESNAGVWEAHGDPTEAALVVLGEKAGLERADIDRRRPRVREFAFDSSRRRMTTVHMLPSGRLRILTKGSPEALFEVAAMSPPTFDRASATVDRLAAEGLRVIALGVRDLAKLPATAADAEKDLELVGLVGIADPIRPDVPVALERCREAGIRVLIVTGDHPSTARTVAEGAGFAEPRVALGSDMPEREDRLGEWLAGVDVLARVAPEQKLRITEALQARGEVVAMTGDGVNDAPALRRADIGVAMGQTGTDVAREAADMVLLDDNLAHLVRAVEEGRAAFDNIGKFLTYHLTDNVAELAPFVVWALSLGRIPLLISVLQVLALDIGTDLLPALALGAERPSSGVMRRPPLSRRVQLLGLPTLARAFGFLGPIEAAVSMAMVPLGAWLFMSWAPGLPLPGGDERMELSAMLFASIVLLQMANALECRSPRASAFGKGFFGNRLLLSAIGVELLSLLGFLYLPPLAAALGQLGLSLQQWALVAVSPFVLIAAEEARKSVVRLRNRKVSS